MAKKETKVLKTLCTRAKIFRSKIWNDHKVFTIESEEKVACWTDKEIKRMFGGKTICPVGKTATVKITIEVEKIE